MSRLSDSLPYGQRLAVNLAFWRLVKANWPNGWLTVPAFGSAALTRFLKERGWCE